MPSSPPRPVPTPPAARSSTTPPPGSGRTPTNPARLLAPLGRPAAITTALVVVYALGSLVAGVASILADPREVTGAIAVWGLSWLVLAGPSAAIAAYVGWRADSVLAGVRAPARWWLTYTIAMFSAAHWLPLCLWTPALIVAVGLGTTDVDSALLGAMVAVVPWVITAGGIAAAIGAAARLDARDWRNAPPYPERPSPVPTSVLVGAVYGAAITAPALAWMAWVDQTGRGTVWAATTWALVGVGAALVGAGLTGGWLERAAALAPRLERRFRPRQLEVAGVVLLFHWLPVLGWTWMGQLLSDPDTRFTFSFVAHLVVIAATTVASFARVARVTDAVR